MRNWETRFWQNYHKRTKRHYTHNRHLLTKAQKREIAAFYAPWCKVHMAEHTFYTEKTGLFSPLYIPDGIHYTRIDRFFNDWRLAQRLDNKCLLPRLLPGVPMVRDIAYRISGFWQTAADYQALTTDALYELLQQEDEVVIKLACDSYGGHGVRFVKTADLQRETFMELFCSPKHDYVIQAALKQSSTLARLNPSSVNTIRIISLLGKDGKVTIYSSVMRMGIGSARVDNASSGGVVAGICADGRLKPFAFSVKGEKYNKVHPGSGVAFEDIVIPHFEQVQDLAVKAHPMLPPFRLLSWDIALDENDSPILIEVNMSSGELDFHQLNNGPLFGEDTAKILAEVFCSSSK